MQQQRRKTAWAWAPLLLACVALLLLSPVSVRGIDEQTAAAALAHSLASAAAHMLPPAPAEKDMGTLLHAQILHRHGDRSPVHINPAQQEQWRQKGLRAGQLSAIGVGQMHSLGRFMRNHYIRNLSFLPLVAGDAVHVRSTDVDRCLQSVHALLDELYPRSMQPVHTVPTDEEQLLQPTDKCPSYLLSYRNILSELDGVLRSELTRLSKRPGQKADDGAHEHGAEDDAPFDLLGYLATESGWGNKLQPTHMIGIGTDNLVCRLAHGLPVPKLLEDALPLLRNYTKQVYFNKFSSFHVRREWAAQTNSKFSLPDHNQGGSGMDPRGSVGGVLVNHVVHHWEQFISVHKELEAMRKAGQEEEEEEIEEGQETAMLEMEVSMGDPSARHQLKLPHKSAPAAAPVAAPVAPAGQEANFVRPPVAHPPAFRESRKHKRNRKASRLLLQEQKLLIYSAHDTTLIALMESLGLITSPHSEYLYPPYATSMTLELRQRGPLSADASLNSASGYYVNAYYGFPTRIAGNPADDAWEYARHPVALRCPSNTDSINDEPHADRSTPAWKVRKAWQCPLEAFMRYVHITTRSAHASTFFPASSVSLPTRFGYAPGDGCCEKLHSFYAQGCDSTTSNVTELRSECIAFRQRCPTNACENGRRLDAATFLCEIGCTDPDSPEAEEAEVRAAAAAGAGSLVSQPDSAKLVADAAGGGGSWMSYRHWLFLGVCLSCMLIGLYACWRADRARKEIQRQLAMSGAGSLNDDGSLGGGGGGAAQINPYAHSSLSAPLHRGHGHGHDDGTQSESEESSLLTPSPNPSELHYASASVFNTAKRKSEAALAAAAAAGVVTTPLPL